MFLIISLVLTGLSLCVLIWIVSQPAVRQSFEAGAHGRHVLLHLVWPWVSAFRPLCEPFISWRTLAQLAHRMRLAAMDPVWEPADLVALQLVIFIVCCVMMVIGARTLVVLPWGHAIFWSVFISTACAWVPRHTITNTGQRRQRQMLRELPFLLDMTTLCVEAGLNLQGALQRAARYGPPGPLRDELHHTLADIRAGVARIDALGKLAERTDLNAIASLVAALKQADQIGSSLGPLLRAQSDQRRSERFLRAEEMALKAPVKMLFPMVVCIFPCTFLIIGFPVALKVFNGVW